jgi:nicotinamide mononucleotide transporter
LSDFNLKPLIFAAQLKKQWKMNATTALYIEIAATLLSLAYLILLIRENIWCWIFGILSSILSIFLFLYAKLYSESILYFFYTLNGFYGWYTWLNKGREDAFQVSLWNAKNHTIAMVTGFSLAALVGYLFDKNTDAANPYVDAHTSVFGLVASYMEANKILTGWIFWIVLNAVSVWLYWTRGLEIYAGLMVVYFILSFTGFYEWHRRFQTQKGEIR